MATRDPDFPLVPHFTIPHVQVQVSGTLGAAGADEIWAMGMKMMCHAVGTPGVPVQPSQEDVNEIADAALEAFAELILYLAPGTTAESGLVSSDVSLTESKAYLVGADNHADVTLQTAYRFPTGPVVGHAPPGQDPYAVACVLSFTGDSFRKGLAAHGRVYVPGANIHVSSTSTTGLSLVAGLMSPESVGIWSAAGGALIQKLKSASPTTNLVHVPVMVGVSKVNQGLARWQAISHVIVDNRPDTVRRRQNKLGGKGKISTQIT